MLWLEAGLIGVMILTATIFSQIQINLISATQMLCYIALEWRILHDGLLLWENLQNAILGSPDDGDKNNGILRGLH